MSFKHEKLLPKSVPHVSAFIIIQKYTRDLNKVTPLVVNHI